MHDNGCYLVYDHLGTVSGLGQKCPCTPTVLSAPEGHPMGEKYLTALMAVGWRYGDKGATHMNNGMGDISAVGT